MALTAARSGPRDGREWARRLIEGDAAAVRRHRRRRLHDIPAPSDDARLRRLGVRMRGRMLRQRLLVLWRRLSGGCGLLSGRGQIGGRGGAAFTVAFDSRERGA